MLSWKCIRLVDQEQSGQGQPIWATPLPSKWVFYSIKQGDRSDFCPSLYIKNIIQLTLHNTISRSNLGVVHQVKQFCKIVNWLIGFTLIKHLSHSCKNKSSETFWPAQTLDSSGHPYFLITATIFTFMMYCIDCQQATDY